MIVGQTLRDQRAELRESEARNRKMIANIGDVIVVIDANGVIRVTYYWPLSYYSEEMWIHAMLVIDGRAEKESETGGLGNIPQDFIALTMIRSGVTSASGVK